MYTNFSASPYLSPPPWFLSWLCIPAGLELAILLPHLPEWWECRHGLYAAFCNLFLSLWSIHFDCLSVLICPQQSPSWKEARSTIFQNITLVLPSHFLIFMHWKLYFNSFHPLKPLFSIVGWFLPTEGGLFIWNWKHSWRD